VGHDRGRSQFKKLRPIIGRRYFKTNAVTPRLTQPLGHIGDSLFARDPASVLQFVLYRPAATIANFNQY
jgi:hypothetical protein